MRLAMNRMAVGLLALAAIACGDAAAPAPEAPAATPQPAQTEAQPTPDPTTPAPAPTEAERWLLSEFDWGDPKSVVYETVFYTDGFLCYRHKLREHCAFVKVRVDGEELLAKFQFVNDKLWRIQILTPDLDEKLANEHLERVWRLLADYVTRFHGAPAEQRPFPDWRALAPGAVEVTQLWSLPDQEIRVLVGRSRDDAEGAKWFSEARFTDPKWVKVEPAPEPEVALPAEPPR